MTINKVGSKGIEDGTVAAIDFANETVSSEKFADATIENAKLSNSSITASGSSISLGGSATLNNQFVDWQSVVTGDTTMVAGRGYFVNTTSGAVTMTLPSSASIGDFVAIKDYAGTFATNNLTIARNGHKIQNVENNSKIDTNRASLVLVYVDSTKGWLYWEESNVADLQLFIEATGGTVSTSGDYKIHTFTGDGNFVVSKASGLAPLNEVSYLVLAGGGSGATNLGGGGAGGFREGRSGNDSYSVSPLNAPAGITVSAQTYPITVGAGGAAGGSAGPSDVESGNPGSNSVFSTITSAGGGGGARAYDPVPGKPGGSGGGGSSVDNPSTYNKPGGTGNTPPVSPPQGNNGGNANGSDGSNWSAGGGGGAGAVGGNAPQNNRGGDGGAGVSSTITGSETKYAGGGAGGMYAGPGNTDYGGDAAPGFGGGYGGGGGGRSNPAKGPTAGVANKGGGGGGEGVTNTGHGQPDPHLNSGGKGIVILRYKFQ